MEAAEEVFASFMAAFLTSGGSALLNSLMMRGPVEVPNAEVVPRSMSRAICGGFFRGEAPSAVMKGAVRCFTLADEGATRFLT